MFRTRRALKLPKLMILAAVIAGTPRLALADRPTVAIVPGIAVNLDAARVDALAQQLADALRAELDIATLGGLEVRRRLPAADLPPDCVANRACIADVAKRLNADQLLFVVMVDTGTGGAIQVDSTWVDPATGRTASRPAIDIATLTSAKAQFAASAQQLLPDAPVRPRPETGVGRWSPGVPRHLTLPAYVTAGATLAGLGIGTSFAIASRNRYRDCEERAARGSACSAGRKDAIRTAALVADAGWVIAVGGTIATAVLYATSGESPQVVVEPAPGGVAITAVGRF